MYEEARDEIRSRIASLNGKIDTHQRLSEREADEVKRLTKLRDQYEGLLAQPSVTYGSTEPHVRLT